VVVAHLIREVAAVETPAGTGAEEYTAICGESMFSYYYPGGAEPRYGARTDAQKKGIPFCKSCAASSTEPLGNNLIVAQARSYADYQSRKRIFTAARVVSALVAAALLWLCLSYLR